jgi:hypothetical protein
MILKDIQTIKLNIHFCLSELLRNIRTQVLIKLIKPYTRIHIPFISKVFITTNFNDVYN